MAALDELDMTAGGAARGETCVAAPPSLPSSEDIAPENTPDDQADFIADAGEHSDLRFPAAQRSNNKIRQLVRGSLRPLLTVATAQYALVTAIAGLTAYAVASSTSKLVNTALEPIIAAFKRL